MTAIPYLIERRNDAIGMGSSISVDTILKELVIYNPNSSQIDVTFTIRGDEEVDILSNYPLSVNEAKVFNFSLFIPSGTSYTIIASSPFSFYMTGVKIE